MQHVYRIFGKTKEGLDVEGFSLSPTKSEGQEALILHGDREDPGFRRWRTVDGHHDVHPGRVVVESLKCEYLRQQED